MSSVRIVVGTRPQVIKLASLVKAFDKAKIDYGIVHTGQHYDFDMDMVFFQELGLPKPEAHLGVGSGSHAHMTGNMLIKLEDALKGAEMVLVPGDTNSALAGGLAGVKMGIPVAHVEAGLRSRLQFMPEEINRVMLDHMSQLLFAPTKAGEENLLAEGIPRKDVHRPGDVMADNIAMLRSRIDGTELPGDLEKKGYVYVTVHRAENVDDPDSLREVVEILTSVPDEHGVEVVFPVHPHTRKRLEEQGTFAALSRTAGIHLIGPASYLVSLRLARDAAVVMTDSGGLHKEAFILGTPAVTLRTVTEWVETVETGWNILAGLDRVRVKAGLETFLSRTPKKVDPFKFYGGGKAASRIAAEVKKQLP